MLWSALDSISHAYTLFSTVYSTVVVVGVIIAILSTLLPEKQSSSLNPRIIIFMKTLKHTAVAAALAAMMVLPAFAVEEGGGSSGGGDSVPAITSQVINRTSKSFKLICALKDAAPEGLCKLQPSFDKTSTNLKIIPQSKIVGENGEERDAGNDGKSTIFINPKRIRDAAKQTKGEERIVQTLAHEIMVLIGAEKNDKYQTSTELALAFKQNLIDFRAIASPLMDSPASKLPVCSITSGLNGYGLPYYVVYKGTEAIETYSRFSPTGAKIAHDAASQHIKRLVLNKECTTEEKDE